MRSHLSALCIASLLTATPAFAQYMRPNMPAPAPMRAPPPPPRPDPNKNPQVIQDRADVKANQEAYAAAEKAYNEASAKITVEFEKQDDYVAAKKAYDDASAEVDRAKAAVLARLSAKPDYKAAHDKLTADKTKLDQLRNTQASVELINDQSAQITQDSTAVSRFESDALTADTPYNDASNKLKHAAEALKVQKDKEAETVKSDTTLPTLKQARDDARTKLVDSQKKLATDIAGVK